MSRSTKDWMKDATASDDDSVRRVNPSLPPFVMKGIREDSASTEEEALAFMRRLRRVPSTAPAHARLALLPWALGGGALLIGAAAVAAVTVGPSLIAPQEQQLTALHLEPGGSHALSASITVSGLGDLSVDRLHDRGAEVSLVDGFARFEVDPGGEARDLVVHAAEVDVTVHGTVFTVQRRGDDVAVDVVRGQVEVTWDGQSTFVGAGESWTDDAVAAEPVVPAAMEPEPGEVGTAEPEPVVPAARPRAAGHARPDAVASHVVVAEGASEALPTPSEPVAEVDPCDEDPFSRACVSARRAQVRALSPEQRFEALSRAIVRVGQDPAVDRKIVDDCNTFLEQYGETGFADDVRAYRVRAAFHGDRASQVVKYADAYLVTAGEAHASHREVQRWRRIAGLRQAAMDGARTGQCADALPLLRELVGLESGVRREEAKAWTGLCALESGDAAAAERSLSDVQEADLAPGLRARVREAWLKIAPEVVEPEIER